MDKPGNVPKDISTVRSGRRTNDPRPLTIHDPWIRSALVVHSKGTR